MDPLYGAAPPGMVHTYQGVIQQGQIYSPEAVQYSQAAPHGVQQHQPGLTSGDVGWSILKGVLKTPWNMIKGLGTWQGIATTLGVAALIAATGGAATPFVIAFFAGKAILDGANGAVTAYQLNQAGDVEGAKQVLENEVGGSIGSLALSAVGARVARSSGGARYTYRGQAVRPANANPATGSVMRIVNDIRGRNQYHIPGQARPVSAYRLAMDNARYNGVQAFDYARGPGLTRAGEVYRNVRQGAETRVQAIRHQQQVSRARQMFDVLDDAPEADITAAARANFQQQVADIRNARNAGQLTPEQARQAIADARQQATEAHQLLIDEAARQATATQATPGPTLRQQATDAYQFARTQGQAGFQQANAFRQQYPAAMPAIAANLNEKGQDASANAPDGHDAGHGGGHETVSAPHATSPAYQIMDYGPGYLQQLDMMNMGGGAQHGAAHA
jgi:hypothetical protein